MTLRYNESAMLVRIRRLDSIRRSALAAATSERLWSALKARGGLREASLESLRVSLDLVWLHARGEPLDRAKVHEMLSRLELLMSVEDTDLYDEDCSASIAYGVMQILDDEPQNTAWAMRRVFESADNCAWDDPESPTLMTTGAEAMANPHPLVQTELARQARDLSEVEALGATPPREAIERFKTRSQAEGLAPVG